MPEVDKYIPNLRGLVDQRAEQLINDAFQRVYEFFERRLAVITEESKAILTEQTANLQQTKDLVNNVFATPFIGGSAPNPLQTLGFGNGTVISVTAGAGLSGGSISTSGTIALLIGTNNVVQKSNGAQLVDTLIGDTGTVILLASVATVDDIASLFILDLASLPVINPGVPGALWRDGTNTIKVSP